MLRIKLAFMLLAVVAATASAFTAKQKVLVDDGFYGNLDRDPFTEQLIGDPNESEADINNAVNTLHGGSLASWANANCNQAVTSMICGVKIEEETVKETERGEYLF